MQEYTIALSRNQLRVIEIALESYFRTHMDQWFDFADDIAFMHFTYDKNDPQNSEQFNLRINRRNEAIELFSQAFKTAYPSPIFDKTPDVCSAIDIWHVIRHQFWKEIPEERKTSWSVDSYPPFPMADEPLINIERKTE